MRTGEVVRCRSRYPQVGRRPCRFSIAHSQPPDFEIVILEQITLYSMSSTSVQQVKIANDGSVHAEQQMVVAVTVVKLESAAALVAMTDVAVKKITVVAKKL